MAEKLLRKHTELGLPRAAAAVAALASLTYQPGGHPRPAQLRPAPSPSRPLSGRAAPRLTPIGPSQTGEAFPFSRLPQPLHSPKPDWLTTSPPCLLCQPRPSGHRSPFLRHPPPQQPAGSQAWASGRRWEGSGRDWRSPLPSRRWRRGLEGEAGLISLAPRCHGSGGGRREERKQTGGGCGTAAAATAAAAACSWPRLPGGGYWKRPRAAVVLCHIVSSPTHPSPLRCGGRADGESRAERRLPQPEPPGFRALRPEPRCGSRARRQRVRQAPGVGRGGGCPVTRPDIFVP